MVIVKHEQDETRGYVYSMQLEENLYTFFVNLGGSSIAIFDLFSNEKTKDVSLIARANILTVVSVYRNDVKARKRKKKWELLGEIQIPDALNKDKKDLVYYSSPGPGGIGTGSYAVYDHQRRGSRPVSRDECIGRYASAVWEAEQLEETVVKKYKGINDELTQMLEILH